MGAEVVTAARTAFIDELHVIAALSAMLILGVAALVVVMLRQVRPLDKAETPGSTETSAPASSHPVETA